MKPSQNEPRDKPSPNLPVRNSTALPGSHKGDASLLELVLKGDLSLPREYRKQKGFFRLLRRATTDPVFRETVQQLRDAVIRSSLTRKDQTSGLLLALTGVSGGEGTSLLSCLLALSLGRSSHYRVAYLDGRLNPQRFDAFTQVLSLSRNACSVRKGENILEGHYNEADPNVYFLKNTAAEHSLEFFSDKQLKTCLEALREAFDFTVIDMPPLLTASSNTFVTPSVDRLYLVVSAGKARLAEVQKCVKITSEVGKDISGVILTHQKAPLWAKLFWRDYFF